MKKIFSAAAAGAILALGLAACGTTNSAASGGAGNGPVSATSSVPPGITAMVTRAAGPQPWSGPTTSPPVEKGVTVVSIPCSMAAVGCARWDSGVHAAARVLGWKVLTIDPAFDPTKMNNAFHQAINVGAKAIVMISIDPSLVANSIAAARKAGIVVVSAGAGYEGVPVTGSTIQDDVSAHGTTQGEWIGATACDYLKGTGNVMLFIDPEFRIVEQRIAGASASLKKCSGITTEEKQISAADLGTVLQNKVAAMLQANPGVTAIISPADAYTTDILVALQQLGLQNKISVFSMDGNQNVVQNLAEGGAVKATIGVGLEWQGWATLDNVNRILRGLPPNAQDGVPIRLISKSFIPPDQTYTGDVDYQKAYTQLWTTGKYPG